MLRIARLAIGALATLLGVALILGGVLAGPEIATRQLLLLVVLGMILMEAGAWKRNNPLLPTERRYMELRSEVDAFIGKVRRLNGLALAASGPEPGDGTRTLLLEMKASVERMADVAGREGDPPSGGLFG